MHEESDVRVEVSSPHVSWYKKQIVVMDPDHFFLLLDLSNHGRKLIVHLLILLPELLPSQIVLEIVKALKVMKEGTEDCFVELEELADGLRLEEYWDTAIRLQDIGNLLLFPFTLGNDTRPPDPDNLDHLALLSKLKHGRVEHGFGLADLPSSCHLVLVDCNR